MDPFAGILSEMDGRAKRAVTWPFCLGTVREAGPGRLVIRSDGMDLDQDELYVAEYLTEGWTEQLTGLSWPLTASLPEATFHGTCEVIISGTRVTGTAQVTRPPETVEGVTTDEDSATHTARLAAGDPVLLLKSQDGQTYYVMCKFVRW